jgi:colicin import membrane protein
VPKPEPPPVVKKPDIVTEKEKKPPPKKEEPKKEVPKERPLDLDLSRQIREQAQRELETAQKERERQQALAQFKTPPASRPASIDPGYADRIRTKIKALIILPPEIAGNPEAIFDVEQLPTGEVLSAKLRRSSGNRAYDEAVERAILKASPLPRPERPDQFQRMLELRFRPLER